MALGIVAVGNIKAQLAANVAGIIKERGSIPVEAVLLEISVKKLIPTVRELTMTVMLEWAREADFPPSTPRGQSKASTEQQNCLPGNIFDCRLIQNPAPMVRIRIFNGYRK